jgi:cytochrome b involved in lipid metabolism
MSKTFTTADVATHKDAASGLYIIIDAGVYDITCASLHRGPSRRAKPLIAFVDEHPGGSKILARVAGKDASKQFWRYHNESVLKKYAAPLKVGTVAESAKL